MKPPFENIQLLDLKDKINFNDIPGWRIQKEMSPPYREALLKKNKEIIKDARIAAVLILIYEENGILKFPVILRNTYKGVHSNQIGFPGGKIEDVDKNLEETAIRETHEEIGANPEDIEILGALTPLYIPPSNFMVHPFVGIYHASPDFTPCDYEVNQIIPIDLFAFLSASNRSSMLISKRNQTVEVPAFALENGMKIWGATAMMLNELQFIVKKSLNLYSFTNKHFGKEENDF